MIAAFITLSNFRREKRFAKPKNPICKLLVAPPKSSRKCSTPSSSPPSSRWPLRPNPRSARTPESSTKTRTTSGGDGTFPILFGYISYRIRIVLYLNVFECILMCILMCPVHIHQDTSRYIKIHQDTFVSISLAIMEMYLTLGYVSFFKIHPFRIHSRYVSGYNVS